MLLLHTMADHLDAKHKYVRPYKEDGSLDLQKYKVEEDFKPTDLTTVGLSEDADEFWGMRRSLFRSLNH